MTTQQVQEKLYDRKSLFTLSGAAGAVWLLCLVIANLDQDHEMLSVTVYKFIALAVSMALAIYMVLRDKRKTRKENYLFAFFNGLLIFVNASGINAISSNVAKLASEPSNDSAWVSEGFKSYEAQFLAFSFFVNDVDWWPNTKQEQHIKDLERQLNKYNNAEGSIHSEDPIAKEYIIYREETQKQLEALTQQLENCKEQAANQESNIERDPTGAVQQDPKLTAALKECLAKGKEYAAEIKELKNALVRCNDALKEAGSVVTRDDAGTPISPKQLIAELQTCENKLDQYRELYKQEIFKNRKITDSLRACQKRRQID